METEYKFISYTRPHIAADEMIEKSDAFYNFMDLRRSVRDFTDEAVSKEIIQNIIKTASTAPSGAHKQPWTFVAVSNPAIKKQIREAAEKEEKEFYQSRAPQDWLDDLAPIGTDWEKPFLETAPWLIVAFKKAYNQERSGKSKNYYVQESIGIACGFLISAIHNAGLITLTHTPSPMNFLANILERPENEKPFLLLPVGYPSPGAQVPDLERKNLDEVSVFM
jgi:nitroreductase